MTLVLSDYERGYLTCFYDTVVFDSIAYDDDEDWFGVLIGDRMFDINSRIDEDTGKVIAIVYECDKVHDNWETNRQNYWVLTDEENKDG